VPADALAGFLGRGGRESSWLPAAARPAVTTTAKPDIVITFAALDPQTKAVAAW